MVSRRFACLGVTPSRLRIEPYKREVNLSAHAEALFSRLAENLEHRAWLERNAEAISRHGQDIAATGIAGEEFDRI